MEQRRRLVGSFELRLKLLAASVERLDFGLPLVHGDLVVQHQVQEFLDSGADPLDLTLGGRQARTSLHPEPVHLACELVAEFFEQLLVQELLL